MVFQGHSVDCNVVTQGYCCFEVGPCGGNVIAEYVKGDGNFKVTEQRLDNLLTREHRPPCSLPTGRGRTDASILRDGAGLNSVGICRAHITLSVTRFRLVFAGRTECAGCCAGYGLFGAQFAHTTSFARVRQSVDRVQCTLTWTERWFDVRRRALLARRSAIICTANTCAVGGIWLSTCCTRGTQIEGSHWDPCFARTCAATS